MYCKHGSKEVHGAVLRQDRKHRKAEKLFAMQKQTKLRFYWDESEFWVKDWAVKSMRKKNRLFVYLWLKKTLLNTKLYLLLSYKNMIYPSFIWENQSGVR